MPRNNLGEYIDISNQKFGMLTVLEFSHFGPWPKPTKTGTKRGRRTYWLCKCDCGKEVIKRKDNLKNNRKTIYLSCGCMHREVQRIRFTEQHKNGINPGKKGLEHWTKKEPKRAKKIALKNLEKANKRKEVKND